MLLEAIPPRKRRRSLWGRLHLWLGLGLCLPFLLIGLSGSILVFWQELDAYLNPHLYEVPQAAPQRDLVLGVEAAVKVAPAGWASLWLPLPASPTSSLPFHFYYPEPAADAAESLNLFVDPSTAQVIGSRVFYHAWNPLRHCFIGFVFKLHYALLSGDVGMIVVGAIAILLIFSVLTGTLLWWPLNGRWRRVFVIKTSSSSRMNHDLHQTAGFYSMPVMLALLVSGLYFNLPNQFNWLVNVFSVTTEAVTHAPHTLATPSGSFKGIERGLQLSDGTLKSLSLQSNGLATLCFEAAPSLSSHVLQTRCLTIDAASGALLHEQSPTTGSAGDHFVQWMWPLHSGQAFGWVGRILVMLCGLVVPVMIVTGLIRWLQKRRVRALVRSRTSV